MEKFLSLKIILQNHINKFTLRINKQSNPLTNTSGYQSRRVNCVRRHDNEKVDDGLCDMQLEPDDTQACSEEACPPEWFEGDWSQCSKHCGEGGERTRDIKCEQIIAGGIPTIIDDSVCLEKVGPKNETTQECNRNVECPNWHLGPWKPVRKKLIFLTFFLLLIFRIFFFLHCTIAFYWHIICFSVTICVAKESKQDVLRVTKKMKLAKLKYWRIRLVRAKFQRKRSHAN